MSEFQLPPSIAALSKSCETICEAECCGLGAFSFSPFNVIYHLTKWQAEIRENDVATIHAELADLSKIFQTSSERPETIISEEWNAILTEAQLLALIDEIGSAVSEACSIYAIHKDRVDARYQNYLLIIK